jgi:hypothetical protein
VSEELDDGAAVGVDHVLALFLQKKGEKKLHSATGRV